TGSPTSEAEFRVAFSPTEVASYSAFLLVNTINVILQGTGARVAVLTVEGSTTPLAEGSTVDFGQVKAGSIEVKTFTLTNPGSKPITFAALPVPGAAFRGPIGATAPIQLAAGQAASFQVAFSPQSGQATQGSLAVDKRTFVLKGQGLNPPLPKASIV